MIECRRSKRLSEEESRRGRKSSEGCRKVIETSGKCWQSIDVVEGCRRKAGSDGVNDQGRRQGVVCGKSMQAKER